MTKSLALNAQAQELMEQLKKGLRAEHVLIHEFIVTFFMQVNLLPCAQSMHLIVHGAGSMLFLHLPGTSCLFPESFASVPFGI